MQNFIKLIKRSLILAVMLLLAGCVWLRLLEIKNQLSAFEENFRVEVTEQHFIVHFLDPVLLSDDFVYLSKLHPSRIERLADGSARWFLDFRIDPLKEENQRNKRVTFAMTFNNEERLAAFDFSPLFLEMAPAAFLEASIRSLGSGQVDQDKRQLKVSSEDLPQLKAPLPRIEAITSVMGKPVSEHLENGLKVLIYRFKADATPTDPEFADRRLAEAWLYFEPKRNELVRLKGRFAGLKLSIDYKKLQGQRAGS